MKCNSCGASVLGEICVYCETEIEKEKKVKTKRPIVITVSGSMNIVVVKDGKSHQNEHIISGSMNNVKIMVDRHFIVKMSGSMNNLKNKSSYSIISSTKKGSMNDIKEEHSEKR